MRLVISFCLHQLRTLWTNLRGLPWPRRVRSVLKLSREVVGHHLSASASPIVGLGIDNDEKLTVILLNHKRPENVAMIARYMLRGGFVGKLIVSNNSQEYPIEDYVTLRDSRLILLNQEAPSGVGIRFEVAKNHSARYYLCVDDDIFLHSAQLQWIYWHLREFDERPHGIFGAGYDPDKAAGTGWPFVHQRNKEGPVDILNGLFAFTKQHLDEYFRLCAVLGVGDTKALMNGEDIILSFSGSKRPWIHHVGPIWECASASSPGIALYMSRPGFYEERWRIFSELQSKKLLA